MIIDIPAWADGGPIPKKFAMGKYDAASHATASENLSPLIRWSQLPEGTKSLALLCIDVDAVENRPPVNQEGATLPKDHPRIDFHHWVLVDIPPSLGELKEAIDSPGFTPKGKPGGRQAYGLRGLNDYTKWFAGAADYEGEYAGYDGPWPPWNDSIPHRYLFRLHALDTATLGLSGSFDGKLVVQAMQGRVLATAEHWGTYAIQPEGAS